MLANESFICIIGTMKITFMQALVRLYQEGGSAVEVKGGNRNPRRPSKVLSADNSNRTQRLGVERYIQAICLDRVEFTLWLPEIGRSVLFSMNRNFAVKTLAL